MTQKHCILGDKNSDELPGRKQKRIMTAGGDHTNDRDDSASYTGFRDAGQSGPDNHQQSPARQSDDSAEQTENRLTVPHGQHADMRLDVYISQCLENATRNKVQQGIQSGEVTVNGKAEKASYKVQPGDRIAVSLPEPPPPEAGPEAIPLDIVYEDRDLLVIDKPAGMVVHPGSGNWTGTLVNALLHHCQTLSEGGDAALRPGIVHRLDKQTSGLLVAAKHDSAHSGLARQFSSHRIDRSYQAVVWGTPPQQGTFEGAIGRSRKDRKRMSVVSEEEGKYAVTHYRVLEYFDHLALVDVQLETGRTHQIRVHFSHNRYPVFGDATYGGDRIRYGPNSGARRSMFDRVLHQLNRQCLHAGKLGFLHPVSGEQLYFESPLPDDFNKVVEALRKYCRS